MIRILTINKDTEVLRDLLIYDDSHLDLGKITKDIFGEVLTIYEMFKKASDLGVKIIVDSNYDLPEVTKDAYIGDFKYEVDVTPFSNLTNKTYILKFDSPRDDEGILSGLLGIEEVRDILEHDSDFSKLVDQVETLDANENVILGYLTHTYGFNFQLVNYYDELEES